jgi:hypothetical protein
VVAALALSRKAKAVSDLLLVGVFGWLALSAGRNIALFALAAAPVLARHAAPLVETARRRLHVPRSKARPFAGQRVLHAALFAGLLLAVAYKASLVLPAAPNQRAVEEHLPAGAVRYLRAHNPPGALFNSYNWGGYLIWELREYPVFADGRTDLYGDELLTEWLEIANAADGWQQKLEARGVRLALLEPSWALSKLLPGAGWQLLYEDDHSVLYAKP